MRPDEPLSALRPAAMAPKRLPILRAVSRAYEDVWRVLFALRTLVVCALLIILAVKVAEDFVPMRVWNGPLLGHFLDFVLSAMQSFCLTPIMIAIHRFIILDEVTPSYAVDPGQPSFIAFFSWLVALSLLSDAVLSVQEVLTAIGFSAATAIGPTLMVTIVVTIVSLRLTILFPAVAVGARGAIAANALADSKGHVLTIFLIFLLALLPLAALAVGVTLLLGPGVMIPGTPVAIIRLVVASAIHTTVLTLCVAIASRLFQAIGSRLLHTQE
jgi:hypothetical protein